MNKNNKMIWSFAILILIFPFVIFGLLYNYNSSELEYREGVVSEIKMSGQGGRGGKGSSTEKYGNFKLIGDTAVYGYAWEYKSGKLPTFGLFLDIDHMRVSGIKEGDKVAFWFKPGEMNQYEVFDNPENRYNPYDFKKIDRDNSSITNIRGLIVNNKIILKPQYHNYVKKGHYYIMMPAFILGTVIVIGLIVGVILILLATIKHSIMNKK